MKANGFTQAAFHTITIHRAAEHTSDGKTDPQPVAFLPPQIKNCHMSGKVAAALLINAFKVAVPKQSRATGKGGALC